FCVPPADGTGAATRGWQRSAPSARAQLEEECRAAREREQLAEAYLVRFGELVALAQADAALDDLRGHIHHNVPCWATERRYGLAEAALTLPGPLPARPQHRAVPRTG